MSYKSHSQQVSAIYFYRILADIDSLHSRHLARCCLLFFFFFQRRRRHTRCGRDWSSDVCSSDLREILSRHAHVAAERKRAYPVIRRSPLPAEKPGPEADGKYIHAHAKDSRNDKMPQFVDQNHQAQDENDSENRIHMLWLLCLLLYDAAAAVTASRSISSLAIRRASPSAASTSSILSNRTRGVRPSTRSITSGIPRN